MSGGPEPIRTAAVNARKAFRRKHTAMTEPDPQPRLIPDPTEPCPNCDGTGQQRLPFTQLVKDCWLCKGSGVVSDLLARQHRLLMRSND